MSQLRIFDRNDDEFKVRLRSIRTTTIVKGIQLGRRIGQHAGRPKAVGLHLPRATHRQFYRRWHRQGEVCLGCQSWRVEPLPAKGCP
jgi:hypothetical protein